MGRVLPFDSPHCIDNCHKFITPSCPEHPEDIISLYDDDDIISVCGDYHNDIILFGDSYHPLLDLPDFAATEVNDPSVCTSEFTESDGSFPADPMSQFAFTECFMDETMQILKLGDDHLMLERLDEHINMFSRMKISSEDWGAIDEPSQDSKVTVGEKPTHESPFDMPKLIVDDECGCRGETWDHDVITTDISLADIPAVDNGEITEVHIHHISFGPDTPDEMKELTGL